MRARIALCLTILFVPVVAHGFCFGTFHFHVFRDLNGNGVLDPGEPGLPNVAVQVDYHADGTIDATVTTDANGDADLNAIAAFPYRLSIVVPPGATQTTANPPDQGVNCIAFGPTNVQFGLAVTAPAPAMSPAALMLLAIGLASVSVLALRRA